MKAVILAAGFATRFYKEVPKTFVDFAFVNKAMLIVDGKPILEHIVNNMERSQTISDVAIVCNARSYEQIRNWSDNVYHNYKLELNIINNGVKNKENRLGSVGDLHLGVRILDKPKEVFVIGGDTLFEEEFADMLHHYNNLLRTIVVCRKSTREDIRGQYGCVEVNDYGGIFSFEEKPDEPKSNIAATCCYIFGKDAIDLLKAYVDDPKEKKDNAGSFLERIIKQTHVFAHITFGEWFDVGSEQKLEETRKAYEGKRDGK